jgi:hypothetical protein
VRDRGEGAWLGSLASACVVSEHQAVAGIKADSALSEVMPQVRVAMTSVLFERLVISWESSGLSRPILSSGRSSAGTAAMPPSPGSSSAERTVARPSPVLLVCSSRSRSPSPAWGAMARCSGRLGLPICICGQIAALDEVRPTKEGGSRCHRSGRRRIRRQARPARLRSRSRRKRSRAGSSRGLSFFICRPNQATLRARACGRC